jgi:hypothetical protein
MIHIHDDDFLKVILDYFPAATRKQARRMIDNSYSFNHPER